MNHQQNYKALVEKYNSTAQFAKDFITLLRLEKTTVKMIVDGVSLETKNTAYGTFFRDILNSFNFTRILILRSIANVFALGCLGYLMLGFINDLFPDVSISRWYLSGSSGFRVS